MVAPIQDPNQVNPLAQMISDALSTRVGNFGRNIGADIQTFANRAKQGGVPLALAQGFNEIPQVILGGLNNLGRGMVDNPIGRLGIQALAGQRGVEALGLGSGQNQTVDPALSQPPPPPQVQEPQIRPQQRAVQGPTFTPFTPLTAPTLPDPRTARPPDFSAARTALGPPIEAQKIGQAEQLSRAFGGGAAGGLSAIQGAPAGRAATTGEVIAGAGAGIAQAMGQIHQESRQLEAFAQASNQLRNRQLSSIALAEESLIAEQNQATADAWNAKNAADVQMKLAVDTANLQAKRYIPVTDGVLDPTTGQFVSTKQQTSAEFLQSLLLQAQFEKMQTTRTATVLGWQVGMENVSTPMRPAYATAIQATMIPSTLDKILEILDESGKGTFVDQVRRIRNTVPDLNDEGAARTASVLLTEIASMFVEHINLGETSPYGDLFNEPFKLALSLGGAYPITQGFDNLLGVPGQNFTADTLR